MQFCGRIEGYAGRNGFTRITCALAYLTLAPIATGAVRAEEPVPVLEAVVCVGENVGQKVDLTKSRNAKPSVYMFIQKEHWDRPTARLLRELDRKVRGELTDGGIVAVWLTDEPFENLQEHLPKVQQSISLAMTTYAVWPGNAFGPPAWGLTRDDHVTIVTVKDGKILRKHTFRSTNEGDARKVLADFGL